VQKLAFGSVSVKLVQYVWNSLRQEHIDAVSINSFENKLEKKRTCEMDFFKDIK